ncbi:MAG TPA: ABC transporter substrate-binding protein, partial [Opitutaceae bacterium]|nr:ABC transporter substrate-binding protein [Opitutaceae bacterium]
MRTSATLRTFFAVTLLALAGCTRRETPAEAGIRTGTLILGNGAEPADLDPQIVTAFTDMNILVALFQGLTDLDERTAQAVPGAASHWQHSPDGLVWTFHLRPEGKWSDGTPLTADGFVYSFRRVLSPALASEYAYVLFPLKNAREYNSGQLADPSALGARALDSHTLELTLAEPCPWFPALVAHQAWFPVQRATIEKFGKATDRFTPWTHAGNLVGNGPFTLKEWRLNRRIIA